MIPFCFRKVRSDLWCLIYHSRCHCNNLVFNSGTQKPQNAPSLQDPPHYIVARTMQACWIWRHAYSITVQHRADLSLQYLPVIQQNVWLPNEMVRKSHIGHTWILGCIPLEVTIIPVLWDTDTYFSYFILTYPLNLYGALHLHFGEPCLKAPAVI